VQCLLLLCREYLPPRLGRLTIVTKQVTSFCISFHSSEVQLLHSPFSCNHILFTDLLFNFLSMPFIHETFFLLFWTPQLSLFTNPICDSEDKTATTSP
jgi:hypothetical protein